MHVVFDESDKYLPKPIMDELGVDDLRTILQNNKSIDLDITYTCDFKEPVVNADLPKEWKTPKDLTLENVIGNIEKGVSTRKSLNNLYETMAFVSQVEPKNLNEALQDNNWILAMQEELNQFTRSEVWSLVPTSKMNIIGTKWVYKNNMEEHGTITRNKETVVAKGYNQEKGIDYDETYAPVTRLEVVRLLLALSCIKGFKLYQMNVKIAFLNRYLNEEVFVSKP